jgi:hypothetical protein
MLEAVRYLLLLLLFWSWADDVMVSALAPGASNIAAEDDEYLATPVSIKRTHLDRHQVPAHFADLAVCLSWCFSAPSSLPIDPTSCCPGFLHTFLSLQC